MERLYNIGGCATIHEYVTGKLRRLEKEERSFAVLFRYMFSERSNVFYERYENFRIEKTTYGEASDEIEKRSIALKALLPDASKQSVVGLSMSNSLSWLLNYWAILKAGFCPLLLNLRLPKETLEESLHTLSASAVVSDGAEYSVPTVREAALAERAKQTEKAQTEDPFGGTFFVMSSGTSSHVKLCAYTASELFSILLDSEEVVASSPSIQRHYRGQLKQLTFLPFYHIFGFVAVYLWFGFFARTFVELRDYAPETILSTIRRHGVTHVFAVPLFWEKVYAAALKTIRSRGEATYGKFEKGFRIAGKLTSFPPLYRFFSKKAFGEIRKNLFGESICFLISGGGGIRNEILQFFNRIGYHMANGYGMSEIGIASVDLSEKPAVLERGSVGKPLKSYEYRLEDGMLYVRGKSLASYVISDGKRIPRPEWFSTGDLSSEDEGRYYIEGRNDDLVVTSSGENLNPNLIEKHLIVPGVLRTALSSVEEDGAVRAVLVAEVAPFLSEKRLLAIDEELKRKLDEVKIRGEIRRIVYTEDPLIREDEFKLNRKRIASDLGAGRIREIRRGTDHSSENGRDPLSEKLRALYADALQKAPEEVGYETDFFTDEGGSSLDYLLLLSRVQETFGVALRQENGESWNSLSKLEAEIRKRMDDVDSVL